VSVEVYENAVEVYADTVRGELTDVENDQLTRSVRTVAAELSKWQNNLRATTNRGTLFDRSAYAAPDNVYAQMRTARSAVMNDDIVGGIAEVTEGMAFDGIKWESSDADETDVFNQMATEQDLDSVVRKMHRELYTGSTVVLGFWWGPGTFKVRGKSDKGNQRKKEMTVFYPKAITTLDAIKVVPVGMTTFGQERLAWQATQEEIGQYAHVLDGTLQDELMNRFYAGQYTPTDVVELQELTSLHVDPSRLILLNPDIVKRHNLTKPDHLRFADVRLRRVFALLDLKQQLMEADRVNLVGAANYILLVRKGDDKDPAYPAELQNLKENFSYVAKLPVIVSDHRLQIDIITPKTDFTLDAGKYDVLDNRIAATCLGLFGAIGSTSGNRSDTSLDQGRVVARVLENRRHMIRRFLEREIARAVVNHPQNRGKFTDEPNLTFVPNHVALDDDAGWAQAILNLRTTNDLSRESTLEYFGFDQAVEAMRRQLEEQSGMDDIFKTQVPFSAANPAGGGAAGGGTPGGAAPAGKPAAGKQGPGNKAAPAAQAPAGAQGGRPVGGGTPPKNATKAPGTTKTGATKPSGS
jgi:hypothetical protein